MDIRRPHSFMKLVSNANEYLCSSLKSLNMATFALGLRRRTRLISYRDFPRSSEEGEEIKREGVKESV